MIVAILGAGQMGTALAKVIAGNGHNVKIWNIETDPKPLAQIKKYNENKKYLPGIKLPANIQTEPDLKKAVAGASILVIAVPSQFSIAVIKRATLFIANKTICLDASKGLAENLEIIPRIIKKILPASSRAYVGSLSGPAVAADLARGSFAAMDIAAENVLTIKKARQILENDNLKLIASHDLTGVELAGCFKNVYAIALGIAKELKFPLNTISAITVGAIKEMAALIKAAGGKSETALGLCGVGDLIGTGFSKKSRNRRFGACLANGLCTEEAVRKIKQVVEGIPATIAINRLGQKYKIKLPLARLVAACINGKSPKIEMEKYLKSYR